MEEIQGNPKRLQNSSGSKVQAKCQEDKGHGLGFRLLGLGDHDLGSYGSTVGA